VLQILQKIPGGQNTKVFFGTSLLLGACAVPVFAKDTKAGHDLFSQEKPQAVLDGERQQYKDYISTKKEQQ